MNLCYDLIDAHLAGVRLHPSVDLSQMGIKYEHWVAQTLGDCVWLIGCTGKLDALPEYIKELKVSKETIEHYTN